MSEESEKESRNSILSWICFVYAAIIVAIGVSFPITLGTKLVDTPTAFDEYIEFYSVLYLLGIVFLLLHHVVIGTPMKIWNGIKKRARYVKISCSRCWKSLFATNKIKPVDGNHVSQVDICTHSKEEEENQENVKRSIGLVGLKFGIRVSFTVLIVMVLMEFSIFVDVQKADPDCNYDTKIANIVTFVFYIFFQTWYILRTKQEDLEKWWLLNYLCTAHLAATTICVGVFLTSQDCLFKMIYLYLKLLQSETSDTKEEDEITVVDEKKDSALPDWKIQSSGTGRISNASIFNESNPCSLINYVRKVSSEIKPFSYHFMMMYVYCCTILLILLFMHLRKRVYKSSSTATGFFKVMRKKSSSFSSGAGVSLIVVSFITAILSIHASTNVFVAAFLLVLHGQATIVAIVALFKISQLPCTIRKDSSKHAVVFMLFYFFNILISVFGAITEIDELNEHPDSLSFLQFFVEITDIIQATLQGILILIGFYAIVPPQILRNFEMPTEILIHLAATNLSSLISSVFVSQSKLDKLEKWFQFSNTYAETSATIAWTVFDSIMSPAEEFEKLFTIICLVKLHKIWTLNETKSTDD